jgi:hypothetical protein
MVSNIPRLDTSHLLEDSLTRDFAKLLSTSPKNFKDFIARAGHSKKLRSAQITKSSSTLE